MWNLPKYGYGALLGGLVGQPKDSPGTVVTSVFLNSVPTRVAPEWPRAKCGCRRERVGS
jgi:hypothetical protein